MPKFTKEQLDAATAEFFEDGLDDHVLECNHISGAGNNGPITVYKKQERQNGRSEAASE